jgi:ATP-dependent exoDNAse (exonuclease V) beta subunit
MPFSFADLAKFRSLMPQGFEEIEFSSLGTSRSGSYSLYELIEKIISVFGFGSEPDSYLLRFMDAVLEYTSNNFQDIKGFIEWMEDSKDKISILVPGEENAIRVMTIHKAKGLQSPAVILPYANWEFTMKSNSIMWASADEEPFDNIPAYPLKVSKSLADTCFEGEFADEKVMTEIDKLNVLYVAFTRAIERLYINVPDRRSNSNNAGKLIEQVLAEEKTGNTIEYGKKEKKKSFERKSGVKSYSLESVIVSNLDSNAVIELKGKEIDSISPSKRKESIGKGLLLHEALSFVKIPGDTHRAIEKLVSKGLVQEGEKELFIEELNEIVNSENAKDWFSDKWEIKSESEILIPGGKAIRPDRVLIKGNDAVIIDYKTGAESSEHNEQLNKYAEVLSAAGYENIRKYIYYISRKKVIEI